MAMNYGGHEESSLHNFSIAWKIAVCEINVIWLYIMCAWLAGMYINILHVYTIILHAYINILYVYIIILHVHILKNTCIRDYLII